MSFGHLLGRHLCSILWPLVGKIYRVHAKEIVIQVQMLASYTSTNPHMVFKMQVVEMSPT